MTTQLTSFWNDAFSNICRGTLSLNTFTCELPPEPFWVSISLCGPAWAALLLFPQFMSSVSAKLIPEHLSSNMWGVHEKGRAKIRACICSLWGSVGVVSGESISDLAIANGYEKWGNKERKVCKVALWIIIWLLFLFVKNYELESIYLNYQ